MKNPEKNRSVNFRLVVFSFVSLVALCAAASKDRAVVAQSKRPMTFMDIMEMRQATAPAVSPDGKWALYTLNTPDWKAAKSFTDIYLVALDAGLSSTRQMTFTKEKNESSPRWSRHGKHFVFASNREAPQSNANQNQLYLMRPDGGEARKITEAKDGVGAFAFSRDGRWLAFSAGKDDHPRHHRTAQPDGQNGLGIQLVREMDSRQAGLVRVERDAADTEGRKG